MPYIPGKVATPPLGQCMYCGSKRQLTKEHIVPRAFLGDWTLRKSTCEECRIKTHAFETVVAQKMFGHHRAQLKFPSKGKGGRPTHVGFDVLKGGAQIGKSVALSEFPHIPIIAPIFGAPSILSNAPTVAAITWKPWINSGGIDNDTIQSQGGEGLGFDISVPVIDFMKMLAKIAHGAAVGLYGLHMLKPLLPAMILGERQDFPTLIGSKPQPFSDNPPSDKHPWLLEPGVFDRGDKKFLCMGIELLRYLYANRVFKTGRLPPYWVVVSEASPELAELVSIRRVQKTR